MNWDAIGAIGELVGALAVVLANADFADLWAPGFTDPDSLDAGQWTRFYMMGQTYLNQYVTIYKHYHCCPVNFHKNAS